MSHRRARITSGIVALIITTIIWLPSMHLLFARHRQQVGNKACVAPVAHALAARHLQLWTDPTAKQRELDRMRRSNAEWDFMGRTFLVWSLAEIGLRQPDRVRELLPVMDKIIDETIRLEREQGLYFFLMPYAKAKPFLRQPARSQFLDGEIAMMLAARRLLSERAEYKTLLQARIQIMIDRMRQSPVLCAESYPDECWTFCNAIGLTAIKTANYIDGTDNSAFLHDWLAAAKQKLIDSQTGLLISSFTLKGKHLDGPEGSSIWLVAHCLRLIDEEFARDQYERARRELGRELAGFAWSREWPVSWRGPLDIDSGAVIPGLDVSAGGSGLAFVGASSFQDWNYLDKLQTTLDFAAFPLKRDGCLKYCAGNQVGDAVLLYANVLGPMWEKVKAGRNR